MARINHKAVQSQQYALTHNWDLGIPIPQFIPSNITSLLKGPQGFLNLYCETTELPSYEVEMSEIRVNGITTRQPMQSTVDSSIPLVFYEDSDHLLFRFWEYWKKLGSSPKTHTIISRNYCMLPRGFFMNLLDGEGQRTLTYELWGVYPSAVKLDGLTGSGDIQRLNVTLSFQNYEVIL